MKKLIVMMLAALLCAGCDNGATDDAETDDSQGIPIIAVQVSVDTLNLLKTGAETVTETLIASVLPPNTTEPKTVTWSTDNDTVATVSASGVVSAVGEGTAVITVTTDGKKANGSPAAATCVVTVSATDPALFRWAAETDEGLADIPAGQHRMIGNVPMLAMNGVSDTGIVAAVTAGGKKGYKLNSNNQGERSPRSQLVIGTTGTELTTVLSAPEGVLNLKQKVKITIGFSDLTAGVDSSGNPANEYGFQVFVLNNSASSAASPYGSNSRIASDNPNAPPEGGDGEVTIRFPSKDPNGTGVATDDLNAMLQNGFITIHCGYGRTMIVRSILIEPDND
jgi:hypothetical protein